MARREDRASDPKRHRSRFDQQPSPKRSRRDGKVETERPVGEEQKQRHHDGDTSPMEKSTKQDLKTESEKRNNGRNEGAKKVSDSVDVPRSQSHSQQHDDRDNSGQGGRSFSRREATDRGWRKDSREQHGERSGRTAALDTRRHENKVKAQGEDDGDWRHNKFSELQSEPTPTARRRPAFREQKVSAEALKNDKTAADPQKPIRSVRPALEREKQNDKGGPDYRSWDRRERPQTRERGDANRKDAWRSNFPSADRYGDDNRRDRFAAREGNRLGGGYSDKWKHDLFDEASPPRKSEEDQIAKVEALLAP